MSIARLVVVLLAFLVILLLWIFFKTGDPDTERTRKVAHAKPRTRAGELLAARKEIDRRIEELQRRDIYNRSSGFKQETLAQLEAIRAQIAMELAELDRTIPRA